MHPLWVPLQGATATQGFHEGCPAWGRAVPIPAGIIPEWEQSFSHRHAGAAAGMLPARACVTSYVKSALGHGSASSCFPPCPCWPGTTAAPGTQRFRVLLPRGLCACGVPP